MTATFEERLEAATLTLSRRFRWARRTLLSLTPVERSQGTLAVDRWHRLYFNRAATEQWTDAEFVGGLWHEVNHLLRHHPDRFTFVDEGDARNRKLANIASDCEINAEIDCTLPEGVFYPESVGLARGGYAEAYYASLKQNADAKREERKRQRDEEQRDNEEQDDDEYNDESNDDDSNDDEGNNDDEQADGSERDDGDTPEDGEGDESGDSDDDGSGDEGDDADDGTGSGDDGSDGMDDGSDGDDGDGTDGSDDTNSDGNAGSDGADADGTDDAFDDLPDPGCGSAAGGTGDDELDEPSDEEREEVEREERKQARDIMDEYERNGYSPFGGGAESIVGNAKATLEVGEHDWRATFATVVRNAMEQATDEAEDFTFKRMSRRSASFDDIVIPGSFRPIPNLTVVVDSSGSMDAEKVTRAMTEVAAILERLAIPAFRATLCATEVEHEAVIRQRSDVATLLDYASFGGTDMMEGITEAVTKGAEVVVCLTDCECSWDDVPPFNGVPVIVGYVGRGNAANPDRYVSTVQQLAWTTFVGIGDEYNRGGATR